MASSEPYPKSKQLARGERRYRRKVASPKQWQAIIAEKGQRCRVCGELSADVFSRRVQYHHLVSRAHHGDDVADNIVPLCGADHYNITNRNGAFTLALLEQLTDAEYAYMIDKGGEDYPERAYGIRYVH